MGHDMHFIQWRLSRADGPGESLADELFRRGGFLRSGRSLRAASVRRG